MTHAVFSEPGYMAHNKARQDHLASLGLPLKNKSVLELGAGIGDHTPFFLDRGCTVTITDGRPDNVKQIKNRFPASDVFTLNVERPDIYFHAPFFDIVYCYGLLYHTKEPFRILPTIAEWCGGLLLLETCVSPSDPHSIKEEDAQDPRCALDGIGSRPNREAVWRTLGRLLPYVYIPTTQPDHDEFPLDWTDPKGECRAVFVASRTPLENPLLSDQLLMKQTR